MSVRIICGDMLAELPKLDADSIDACVTDPPYGLEFMGKDWDAPWKGDAWQTGAGFSKPGIGERKTAWPSFTGGNDEFGGANPTCSTCGGRARGKKKCACAEPDWRVKGAAPDRMYGRQRQMQTFQAWCEAWAREVFRVLKPGAYLLAFGGTRTYHRLVCAIEDAGFECRDSVAWLYGAGFPKSLNVSKAIDKAAGAEREVIATGASVKRMIPGADQNTDGWAKDNGREFVPNISRAATPEAAAWEGWGTALKPAMELICVARKPLSEKTVAANVLRYGTGAINVDACRVEGEAIHTIQGRNVLGLMNDDGWQSKPGTFDSHPSGRWPANVCHDVSDEVLAAFPDAPGQLAFVGEKHGKRDSVNCYGDYGARPDTAPRIETDKSAARFFYTAKADASDRQGSKHPTVKPTDLMRWLVKLVTPPGGTVLDPFCGTGSTLVAADQLQFNAIGVEQDATYAEDARRKFVRDAGLFASLSTGAGAPDTPRTLTTAEPTDAAQGGKEARE